MRYLNAVLLWALAGCLLACQEQAQHQIPAPPALDDTYYQYVLASLDETLARHPDNAYAYYRKADILLEQGNTDQALATIQKALHVNDAEPSYHLLKAKAFLQKGRYREAFREAQHVSDMGLKSVELYEVLAEASLENNYLREALFYTDSALSMAPKNYKNYLRKGLVLAAHKDTASAEANLLQSIALGAPPAEAYGELVTLYASAGNYQKARVYMEKSLQRIEPNDKTRLLQARIWRHTGLEDSARVLLYQLKGSRTVSQFEVYQELKDWYFQHRTYDSVTYYARQMLNLEPNNKEPMLTLARVYDRRRSYQSAIQTYQHITEMDSLYQEDLHKIAVAELTELKRKVAYLWKKKQEEELMEFRKGIAPMQTLAPGSEE